MSIELTINGRQHTLDVDPDTPFIHVLRNALSLFAAKLGCGLEQCGACVVLVDGAPTYSCTARVADLQGRRIETVEGLAADDGTLHPVQQAFLDLNAAQCGYCTAGILMRAKALIDSTPDPSRDEICAALDPHLCRCGAHPRIIRAVQRAAAAVRSSA